MVTVQTEDEIVSELHLGFSLAIEDAERLDSNAIEYINDTKMHKFYYYAIDHFDLPVTYSWYLAGAHIANDNVRVKNLERNELSAEKNRNVQTYRKFFYKEFLSEEEIEDWWFKPLNEFLREFYTEEAPVKYQELYLRSLELREMFRLFSDELEDLIGETTQTSLLSFSEEETATTSDIIDTFNEVSNRIKLELANSSQLKNTRDEFESYVEVARPVIKSLSDAAASELGHPHLTVVNELNRFYFHHAWQYPCLYISIDTATGPNADMLVNERRARLNNFGHYYHNRLDELENRCSEVINLDS